MYSFDIGLKKDLFKNKAVLSLSISDLFNTRYMRFDSYGSNFMQYTQFKRDSQFLICSLILIIMDFNSSLLKSIMVSLSLSASSAANPAILIGL